MTMSELVNAILFASIEIYDGDRLEETPPIADVTPVFVEVDGVYRAVTSLTLADQKLVVKIS